MFGQRSAWWFVDFVRTHSDEIDNITTGRLPLAT